MASYGLIELGLVFAVVLAAALWELYSVRRSLDRRHEDQNDDDNGRQGP